MKLLKYHILLFSVLIIQNIYSQPNFIQLYDNIFYDSTVQVNEYFLEQIYPQPFGTVDYHKFGIPDSSYVTITIFNDSADTVVSLFKGLLGEGYYSVHWEWVDSNNIEVLSGIYFLRLEAKLIKCSRERGMDFKGTTKIIVIK